MMSGAAQGLSMQTVHPLLQGMLSPGKGRQVSCLSWLTLRHGATFVYSGRSQPVSHSRVF